MMTLKLYNRQSNPNVSVIAKNYITKMSCFPIKTFKRPSSEINSLQFYVSITVIFIQFLLLILWFKINKV